MRMIRRYSSPVLALALSLVSTTAAAAVTQVGLKGGLSIATLHGRPPGHPLLARASFAREGLASPYLLVGPVLGVRLSQQLRLTGDISAGSDIDSFKGADLGLALGTGLELGRGRARGILEARYSLGLTLATIDSYRDDARNGVLLLMTGIALSP